QKSWLSDDRTVVFGAGVAVVGSCAKGSCLLSSGVCQWRGRPARATDRPPTSSPGRAPFSLLCVFVSPGRIPAAAAVFPLCVSCPARQRTPRCFRWSCTSAQSTTLPECHGGFG